MAANSTEPILLTHNPSTKLYNVCIKLLIMIGIAKTPITLYKLSFKIKLLLFLTMFPPNSHLNFSLLQYILYTIDTINFYNKLRMSKYIFLEIKQRIFYDYKFIIIYTVHLFFLYIILHIIK